MGMSDYCRLGNNYLRNGTSKLPLPTFAPANTSLLQYHLIIDNGLNVLKGETLGVTF